MSMLNQAAVEALCSATYLENYLDAMENLPDDLQRVVTQLRELDIQCKDIINDLNYHHVIFKQEEEPSIARRKSYNAIQRALIRCQEIEDEKLRLMAIVTDHIEIRARQLESDRENLDPTSAKDFEEEKSTPVTKQKVAPEEKVEKTSNKRQRRQKNHDTTPMEIESKTEIEDKDKGSKKKKKEEKQKRERKRQSQVSDRSANRPR
ncbi:hypothetical protein ScPMuIL_010943 [Solemya velum]